MKNTERSNPITQRERYYSIGPTADEIIANKLKTTPDAGLTKLPILKIKLRKLFKWWK